MEQFVERMATAKDPSHCIACVSSRLLFWLFDSFNGLLTLLRAFIDHTASTVVNKQHWVRSWKSDRSWTPHFCSLFFWLREEMHKFHSCRRWSSIRKKQKLWYVSRGSIYRSRTVSCANAGALRQKMLKIFVSWNENWVDTLYQREDREEDFIPLNFFSSVVVSGMQKMQIWISRQDVGSQQFFAVLPVTCRVVTKTVLIEKRFPL